MRNRRIFISPTDVNEERLRAHLVIRSSRALRALLPD
jgi:hypothetical protein